MKSATFVLNKSVIWTCTFPEAKETFQDQFTKLKPVKSKHSITVFNNHNKVAFHNVSKVWERYRYTVFETFNIIARNVSNVYILSEEFIKNARTILRFFRSHSVTKQDNFKWQKIAGKSQIGNIECDI